MTDSSNGTVVTVSEFERIKMNYILVLKVIVAILQITAILISLLL